MEAQDWRDFGVMALAIALLGWVVMRNRVRRVPTHHVEVIERLGRYHRTAGPGRHVLAPMDAARGLLDLREKTHVTRREPVQTADGVWVSVRLTIRYRIADPVKWTYEVRDPEYWLAQSAFTELRNVLGVTDLARARDERPAITTRVHDVAGVAAARLGTELIDLHVGDYGTSGEGGA